MMDIIMCYRSPWGTLPLRQTKPRKLEWLWRNWGLEAMLQPLIKGRHLLRKQQRIYLYIPPLPKLMHGPTLMNRRSSHWTCQWVVSWMHRIKENQHLAAQLHLRGLLDVLPHIKRVNMSVSRLENKFNLVSIFQTSSVMRSQRKKTPHICMIQLFEE